MGAGSALTPTIRKHNSWAPAWPIWLFGIWAPDPSVPQERKSSAHCLGPIKNPKKPELPTTLATPHFPDPGTPVRAALAAVGLVCSLRASGIRFSPWQDGPTQGCWASAGRPPLGSPCIWQLCVGTRVEKLGDFQGRLFRAGLEPGNGAGGQEPRGALPTRCPPALWHRRSHCRPTQAQNEEHRLCGTEDGRWTLSLKAKDKRTAMLGHACLCGPFAVAAVGTGPEDQRAGQGRGATGWTIRRCEVG